MITRIRVTGCMVVLFLAGYCTFVLSQNLQPAPLEQLESQVKALEDSCRSLRSSLDKLTDKPYTERATTLTSTISWAIFGLSTILSVLLFLVGLAWRDIRNSAMVTRREVEEATKESREKLGDAEKKINEVATRMINQGWGLSLAFVTVFQELLPEESRLGPLELTGVLQLFHPNFATRRSAVYLLQACGGPDAIPYLKMLADSDPDLLAEVERAIRAIEERQTKEEEESGSNDDAIDESNTQENDTNES